MQTGQQSEGEICQKYPFPHSHIQRGKYQKKKTYSPIKKTQMHVEL